MEIPYKGWIEVTFRLLDSDSEHEMAVPFLVSTDRLDHPIIGFNVIEEIVKVPGTHSLNMQEDPVVNSLFSSLQGVAEDNLTTLINLIRTTTPSELCNVKVIQRDVLIPKSGTTPVTCRANIDSTEENLPVLFEPSTQPTWRDWKSRKHWWLSLEGLRPALTSMWQIIQSTI